MTVLTEIQIFQDSYKKFNASRFSPIWRVYISDIDID